MISITYSRRTSPRHASLAFWMGFLLASRMAAPSIRADDRQADLVAAGVEKAVEKALEKAGKNRAEFEAALAALSGERQEGLEFLLVNMPEHDLRGLSRGFLLENVNLAYDVVDRVPWGRKIPMAVFLNDVLPYASINERRDAWRKPFSEKFLPLLEDCRTASEAAQRLNEKVFGLLGVRYSTRRKKADQSPFESTETGLASCTGLSILLVDACRSVAVPARLAGIPSWVNKRGNHTWVEVWDGGWHFTGAAEPSSRGLDHAWFQRDASLALKESRRHAIYATCFRKTSISFPMVWAPRIDYVSALNVTDRYTRSGEKSTRDGTCRLLVRVLDRPDGRRVAAAVEVVDAGDSSSVFRGTSKDESADRNDILSFDLPGEKVYELRVGGEIFAVRREVRVGKAPQMNVTVHLGAKGGIGSKPARVRL